MAFDINYADQRGMAGLVEQLERDGRKELKEVEFGGWDCILKQAKLSAAPVQPTEVGASKHPTSDETWRQLARIVEILRAREGVGFFKS